MISAGHRTLLEVDDLSRHFGGLVALKSVSFSIGADEMVGLIGPNGAGKTTLFNLISGLLPPSGGDIRLSGESILGKRPDQINGLGAVRTFQAVSLISGMTVWDNVHAASLFRSRARAATRSSRECTLRALELCEIAHLADDFVDVITNADQKRVEIARAVASEPRLLMTDEILAGLNASDGERILDILRAIRASGVSIIFVEHDMRAVMSICDRIIVIAQGVKLAEGAPGEISRNPDVISVYLGGRYAQGR